MINCHQESLPSKRADEIKATLNGKDIDEVIECLTGEMAAFECQASALAIQDPMLYLTSGGVFRSDTKDTLARAARLKIFLSVLHALRDGEYPLIKTTIKII